MDDWLRWGAAIAIGLLSTLVGYLMRNQSDHVKNTSASVAKLHARIDEVKDKYVRRDDFQSFREETAKQLQRIEDKTDRILTQVKH